MLRHDDTMFYRYEDEFKYAQTDFLTYMMEVLNVFPDNHLCQFLCLCHRKIVYTVLKALDEIPQVLQDRHKSPATHHTKTAYLHTASTTTLQR